MRFAVLGHKFALTTLLLWLVGTVLALLWAVPIIWMISTSFKLPGDIMKLEIEWLPNPATLDNYQRVLQEPVLSLVLQQHRGVNCRHPRKHRVGRAYGLCTGAACTSPAKALCLACSSPS